MPPPPRPASIAWARSRSGVGECASRCGVRGQAQRDTALAWGRTQPRDKIQSRLRRKPQRRRRCALPAHSKMLLSRGRGVVVAGGAALLRRRNLAPRHAVTNEFHRCFPLLEHATGRRGGAAALPCHRIVWTPARQPARGLFGLLLGEDAEVFAGHLFVAFGRGVLEAGLDLVAHPGGKLHAFGVEANFGADGFLGVG